MKREPFDKRGSWQPAANDRVCSIHFFDELATDENPKPDLGYENKDKRSRKTLFRKPLEKKWGKVILQLPVQLLKKRKYPCKQFYRWKFRH